MVSRLSAWVTNQLKNKKWFCCRLTGIVKYNIQLTKIQWIPEFFSDRNTLNFNKVKNNSLSYKDNCSEDNPPKLSVALLLI